MKTLFPSLLFVVAVLSACAGPKQAPQKIETSTAAYAKDSVEYYSTDFEIIQKNYLEQLVGSWNLHTMQRQQRMPEESLGQTTIMFNRDMTFEAVTTCGRLTGTFSIKGTSIVFVNPTKSWTSCSNEEQSNKLIELLSKTVSAYTVSSSELLLRDVASNIVFRAGK
jgi:heat shock protein HslJ